MTQRSARATLTQVARLAGVSVASASRALNGLSASPETVEKVRAAAAALGYVPDAMARSLKLGHVKQLAFAVADVGNPVYVEMMRAVETRVREAGYRLLISSTGSSPTEEIDLIKSLSRGYADGMIISPLRISPALVEAMLACPVPLVVVGRLPEGAPIDNVATNSIRGLEMATAHLIEIGRQRIGFVNGPLDTTPGSARLEGFRAALDAAGRPVDDSMIALATDFTFSAGYTAARTLLAAQPQLDAIVAANDLLAVGAMRAAFELGRTIPGDLAVAGMDDTELARQYHPALTSVSLGSQERGAYAADLLLDRLVAPGRPARRFAVEPELVVRESTVGEVHEPAAPVGSAGRRPDADAGAGVTGRRPADAAPTSDGQVVS